MNKLKNINSKKHILRYCLRFSYIVLILTNYHSMVSKSFLLHFRETCYFQTLNNPMGLSSN